MTMWTFSKLEATNHNIRETFLVNQNMKVILSRAKSSNWHEKVKFLNTNTNVSVLHASKIWELRYGDQL